MSRALKPYFVHQHYLHGCDQDFQSKHRNPQLACLKIDGVHTRPTEIPTILVFGNCTERSIEFLNQEIVPALEYSVSQTYAEDARPPLWPLVLLYFGRDDGNGKSVLYGVAEYLKVRCPTHSLIVCPALQEDVKLDDSSAHLDRD